MPQIFVITASNQAAQHHVELSVAHPVNPDVAAGHFSPAVLEEIKSKDREFGVYAWGAVPGPSNLRNWGLMQPGDVILLYQAGVYTFVSHVIRKERNRGFAQALWGTDPEGKTWELMYFLDRPAAINVPVGDLANWLPSCYRGFTRIAEERVDQIVSQYRSVEDFLAQHLKVERVCFQTMGSEVRTCAADPKYYQLNQRVRERMSEEDF